MLAVAYTAYSSTIKMKAVRSSETAVNLYQTTGRHALEDSISNHRREELRYCAVKFVYFNSVGKDKFCCTVLDAQI